MVVDKPRLFKSSQIVAPAEGSESATPHERTFEDGGVQLCVSIVIGDGAIA